MSKADPPRRFSAGLWATVRETGEHVKIENWSKIAASYRAHSSQHGLLYLTDAELEEVVAHPEEHLGKYWSRCRNSACGAPLTPGLPTCERCETPKCTCGRCSCRRTTAAASTTKRAARKK